MKIFVVLGLLAVVHGQNCAPTNFFAIRHTERFDGGVDTLTPTDAVLTTLGRENSEFLRDTVMAGIPIEHIFVTSTTYSFQTAMPLALATGLPLTAYLNGVSNSSIPNPDLAQKIADLSPCPDTILIVSHGFQLQNVFATLGYFEPMPDNHSQFQRLFNLRVQPDGSPIILTQAYFGPPGGNQNQPLPCTPIPSVDDKQPPKLSWNAHPWRWAKQ